MDYSALLADLEQKRAALDQCIATIRSLQTPVSVPPSITDQHSRLLPKPKRAYRKRQKTTNIEKPIGDGLTVTQVKTLLAKRPMTSGDLCRQMKSVSVARVYQVLAALRKSGEIVTKEDDVDGLKKNFLLTSLSRSA